MNKARRKWIEQVVAKLEEISSDIGSIAGEEQDYVDCAPENLMYSERYEHAGEVASDLEEMGSEVDDIISRLGDACE